MSNIPKARAEIAGAIEALTFAIKHAQVALNNMTREKPDFKAKGFARKFTAEEKARIRKLRAEGWSLEHIAQACKSNSGRISEITKGKR